MSRSQQNADYLTQQSYIASIQAPILRGYIQGAQLSTAGSSTTMSIASGMATDSTNSLYISLASSISKTTSAWVAGSGNGGIDTGAIAVSTWYYFYLIYNPTSVITDVIFSTSSSAPTLPSGYTQYRYIGAGLTNGSSQWTSFVQTGRRFTWSNPVLDLSSAGSTTAVTQTLTVPRGRKMLVDLNVGGASGGTGGNGVYLSDLGVADLAPSSTSSPLFTFWVTADPGTESSYINAQVTTNTSAQIRRRHWNTAVTYIATTGWTDLADSQ